MPIDFDVNSKVEGNESQVGKIFCNRRNHIMFPVSPTQNLVTCQNVDCDYNPRAWSDPACRVRCYDVHDGGCRNEHDNWVSKT
jgi:hypothetical protein